MPVKSSKNSGCTDVLVISQDLHMEYVQSALEDESFCFQSHKSVFKGIAVFAESPCDIVIIDLEMLSEKDLECITLFRETRPDVFILALYLPDERKKLNKALDIGVDGCLSQPFYPEEVASLLRRWAARLHRSNDHETEVEGRLKVLAKLAKGMAHEINNPLMTLSGSLEVLESQLPDAEKDTLGSMREEVERIANVVDELLIFGQKMPEECSAVDINSVLRQIVEEKQQAAGNVRMECDLSEEQLIVWGDEDLLETACRILIQDGLLDSKDDSPKIDLFTSVGKNDEWVNISIQNKSGRMVSDSEIEAVFDPFNIEPQDPNMTFAYPVVYGILRAHGGTIQVNKAEEGIEFKIQLPRVFV